MVVIVVQTGGQTGIQLNFKWVIINIRLSAVQLHNLDCYYHERGSLCKGFLYEMHAKYYIVL